MRANKTAPTRMSVFLRLRCVGVDARGWNLQTLLGTEWLRDGDASGCTDVVRSQASSHADARWQSRLDYGALESY